MEKRFTKLPAVLFCALLIGLWSCTDFEDSCKQEEPAAEEQEVVQTPSLSLEDAVLHQGTETYMVPQKDPYTLANFQNAYDKLASGNSTQVLTRAQTDAFSGSEQLQATHYALRIFPRNEDEQWKIELMEDVTVSYIPFDHVQVPARDIENMLPVTRSEIPVYPEETRYEVTYDDLETLEGPVAPETYTMPVLYVVWPCGKPLPDDMDYEIDYGVFLPPYEEAATRNSTVFDADMLQILENEAVSLALGVPAHSRVMTRVDVPRVFTGLIYTIDRNITGNIPIANLKIQLKLGTSINETYTDADGRYTFNSWLSRINPEASFVAVFQHEKWKITKDNTTSPYSAVWGDVYSFLIGPSYRNLGIDPTWTEAKAVDCHRAVNYLFNVSAFPEYNYSAGIRIIASSTTNGDVYGSFNFSKTDKIPAYIIIYNKNLSNPNHRIGVTLHELGHALHMGLRGGMASNFIKVEPLISESFACYVGWYLGQEYYFSLGYMKPYIDSDITGQSQQTWKRTDKSDVYSPLFVDLVDDYNQFKYNVKHNNDPIKNFPHNMIFWMANECLDYRSVKASVKGYANLLQTWYGIYYTSNEIDDFFSSYYAWDLNL